MINVENPDYDMCVEKQYLVRDSRGVVRPFSWWHGDGALLDYTNPAAVEWWHSLMDRVLDAGVDGFKCDGTDPYILEYSLTGGALGYQDQAITYHQYATMYYRDFLQYTRQKRSSLGSQGDAGLIMSRPIDCSVDSVTKLCNPFSPRDVMYSGWVGDDDATWQGMRGCLRKVIYSSWSKFANFGCDIGGYRGNDNAKDRTLFTRWAQLGAFLPLMENGGGGEHKPWMYDEEVASIYRTFATEHHRISAYLHTMGANAIDTTSSTLHPVDELELSPQDIERQGISVMFPQPKTFSYRLGDDLLVHPVMYHETNNTSNMAVVDMTFPKETLVNSTTVWLDWWHPTDLKRAHKSGDRAARAVPLDSFPVYVRQGAILPLHNVNTKTQQPDLNKVTFTWFGPQATSTKTNPATFSMRESMTTGTGMTATAYFADAENMVVEISAHPGPVGFDVIGVSEPSTVDIQSWKGAECTQHYFSKEQKLSVDCGINLGGLRIKVNGVSPTL
jgi:alpha-glucosidase (family GH31 glycosyl hydrolase)